MLHTFRMNFRQPAKLVLWSLIGIFFLNGCADKRTRFTEFSYLEFQPPRIPTSDGRFAMEFTISTGDIKRAASINGVSISQMVDAFVQTCVIEVRGIGLQGQSDLNYVKEAKAYIGAPSLTGVLVASLDQFPLDVSGVLLPATNNAIDDFLILDEFLFRIELIMDEPIEGDNTLSALLQYQVITD